LKFNIFKIKFLFGKCFSLSFRAGIVGSPGKLLFVTTWKNPLLPASPWKKSFPRPDKPKL